MPGDPLAPKCCSEGRFWDPVGYRKMSPSKISRRASRVPLGKRALGSCWAKGPAVVGIRGALGRGPYGPQGSLGVLGGWANGAVGGCSAAIPNGKPFRMDCNGASTELLPPVTCLRINGFARNVILLKRSSYGGAPTRDTS